MLFELNTKDNRSKEQRKLLYDNATNRFYDFYTRQRLETHQATENKETQIPYYEEIYNPRYNLRNEEINVVIVLGLKCNLNCKYCGQKNMRSIVTLQEASPKKVNTFISMLLQAKLPRIRSFTLWGGEPMVYWKTIRGLVPELKKHFPKAKIGLTTNGTLLTKEKTDFLSLYKVDLAVSYDGSTSNRADESLLCNEQVVIALRSLKRFGVMRTLNNVCVPYKEIQNELQKKGLNAFIAYHSIARAVPWHEQETINEIKVKDDKIREHQVLIYNNLKTNTERQLYDRYRALKQSIQEAWPIDLVQFKHCEGHDGSKLTLDLDGNIYVCQGCPIEKIGRLSPDIDNSIDKSKPSKVLEHLLFRRSCLECFYVAACCGGCQLVKETDANDIFKINCKNGKGLYLPLIVKAIEDIFDCSIESVKEYRTQKLIDKFNFLHEEQR